MQLFRQGKVPLNRLFPQLVVFPYAVGVAALFRFFQLVCPHMSRHGLNVVFAVCALREIRTTRADRATAFVFPVTVTVGCGIAQYLVIGANVAMEKAIGQEKDEE